MPPPPPGAIYLLSGFTETQQVVFCVPTGPLSVATL